MLHEFYSLTTAISTSLSAWAILILTLLGLGLSVRRATIGRSPLTLPAGIACFWCGLSVSIAFLQLWTFFFPVNILAVALLILGGSIGLASSWNVIYEAASKVPPGSVLILAFFAVWTADRSLAEGGYDDLYYEWQAVRWYGEYPIVPGLANLNERIGFNNAHHLLAAAMNQGPLAARVNHALLGVFILPVAAQIVWAVRNPVSAGSVFALTLIAPCFIMLLFGMFGPMISTLKADILIVAISLSSAALLIHFAKSDDPDAVFASVAVLLLSATSVAIKFSAVVFAAGLIVIAAWLQRRSRLAILLAFIGVAVIVSSWLARGVVISGYPLYPSRIITAPVSWRVHPEIADAERVFISSWGRDHTTASIDPAVLATRPWFSGWLSRLLVNDKFTTVLPFCVSFAGVIVSSGLSRNQFTFAPRSVLLVAVLATIFWFMTAPTTRFGYGFFWIAAAASLAQLVNPGVCNTRIVFLKAIISGITIFLGGVGVLVMFTLPNGTAMGFAIFISTTAIGAPILCLSVLRGGRIALIALLFLGCSPLVERCGAHLVKGRLSELISLIFTPPGEDGGYHYYKPIVHDYNEPVMTQSGLKFVIYDMQPISDPLFTSPLKNPALRLRDPNDVSKGFMDSRLPDDK